MAAHEAAAATNVWTSHGPEGLQQLTTLATDPGSAATIFLGTDGAGVFKSQDGGTTWSEARNGLPSGAVRLLFVDPTDSATVYAAFAGTTRLFKSSDGGASWSPASDGVTGSIVTAIAVDPTNAQTVYLGTNTSTEGGVFKSTNGGAKWDLVNTGLPTNPLINGLVIDPANPQTLYAALRSADQGEPVGVFKSTNGADSWTAANEGLNPTRGAGSLAIDPSNPQTLYVVLLGDNFEDSVFKSTNGAQSWEPATDGLDAVATSGLVVDPNVSQTVYVQTEARAFQSIDAGGFWTPVSFGLPTRLLAGTLRLAHQSPQNLYVAVGNPNGAVFKTGNSGQNWTAAGTDGLSNTSILQVDIDPASPQTVYAGVGSTGGLSRSRDRGQSWTKVGRGLPNNTAITALVIHPSDPQTLYVNVSGLQGFGAYQSTNGGDDFAPISTEIFVNDFAVDVSTPATLYAGAAGVFKRTEGDTGFTPASVGLPEEVEVRVLKLDPTNPSIIYAGTRNGIFKSTNGAETWEPTDPDLATARINALAIDPTNPQRLYAGTTGLGVRLSIDGGLNWDPAADDVLTSSADVRALGIDPSNALIVYAATLGSGVYRSINGGQTWEQFSAGLFNPRVADLAIDPTQPTRLYAATGGAGVFDIDIDDRCPAVTCTPTVGVTPTPTSTPVVCAGDCDGGGEVTVDELVRGVTIVLGTRPAGDCLAIDSDHNGSVAINELVRAVNSLLNGCA